MAKTFPWDQFDNVTFERGICVRKNETGTWFHVTSETPVSVSAPEAVLNSLKVRPVLAEGPCGNTRLSTLLPSTQGRLLNIYRSELNLPRPLQFVMGAMLYHCSALARLYARECSTLIERWPGKMANGKSPRWAKENRIVTILEEHFYEFEALITTIVRGYEYIRYPIWEKYESGENTPPSFEKTIERCKFPPELEKRITLSQKTCYEPAKSYRHCIQHNVDIGSSSWCMFEKKMESFWSLIVRLPDNPATKSAKKFTFHRGLDALTVGWEYVSEFFAVADIIIGEGDLSSI